MANRRTLIQSVSKATGLSQRETSMCIDGFIEAISVAISRGEQVDLRGLGTFAVRQTAPRKIAFASNAAVVPSHGRIVFRPGEKLRMSAWNNEK